MLKDDSVGTSQDGEVRTALGASFNYRSSAAMSAEVKEVMALFDHDQSGRVTTSDLMAAAKSHQEIRAQNTMMWKLMQVLVVTMGLLLGCMFGLTMLAINVSKDTTVANQQLLTRTGDPVQVKNSEMHVGENGQLFQGGDGSGRRLSEEAAVSVASSDFYIAEDGVLRQRNSAGLGAPVRTVQDQVVMDLTDADFSPSDEDLRRLEGHDGRADVRLKPGGRITWKKVEKFGKALKEETYATFGLKLLDADGDPESPVWIFGWFNSHNFNEKKGRFMGEGFLQVPMSGATPTTMPDANERVWFRMACKKNRYEVVKEQKQDLPPCNLYIKKGLEADWVDESLTCIKAGVCPKRDVQELHVGWTEHELHEKADPSFFSLEAGDYDTVFFYEEPDNYIDNTIAEWSDSVIRRRRGTTMGAWGGLGSFGAGARPDEGQLYSEHRRRGADVGTSQQYRTWEDSEDSASDAGNG